MASMRHRIHSARTALVHRARRHGTVGIKTLAIGGLVGAVAEKAVTFAAAKSKWVQENWYGTPVVLAAGAYAASKKFPQYAQSLAGAAGFAFMYAYDVNKGSVKPASTTGYDDAGAPEDAINF